MSAELRQRATESRTVALAAIDELVSAGDDDAIAVRVRAGAATALALVYLGDSLTDGLDDVSDAVFAAASELAR